MSSSIAIVPLSNDIINKSNEHLFNLSVVPSSSLPKSNADSTPILSKTISRRLSKSYKANEFDSTPNDKKYKASLIMNKLHNIENIDYNFKFIVFVKEFLYHSLIPFSIPFCLYFDGLNYTKNHEFLNFPGSFVQYVVPLMLYIMDFIYYNSTSSTISFIEIFIANVLFFLHRSMIACKYSYLDPATLNDLHNRVYTADELRNKEVIGGWLSPSLETVHAEIDSAANRLGYNLSNVIFHVNSTKEELANFLEVDKYYAPEIAYLDGYNTICLRGLLCHLAIKVSVTAIPYQGYLVIFCSLINAFIATLIRVSHGYNAFGDDTNATLIISLCIFLNFFFFAICLEFIVCGITDYIRRGQLSSALSLLIDPSEIPEKLNEELMYAYIPQNMIWVDLSIEQNIAVWYVARKVLKNFGFKFHKRIQTYTSLIFVLLLCLLIFLISETVTTNVASTITIFVVFYNLILLTFCVILMIYYATRSNDAHLIQLSTLAKIQMSVCEAISNDSYSSSSVEKLLKSLRFLMEVDDQISPTTIFGVRASIGLLGTVFSVVSSVSAVVLRYYRAV